MSFTFLHPQYLFLLFAIPILFFIHFFALSNKKKKALKFANFDAIAKIQGVDFFSKNVIILALNVFISLLVIFSVSGITYHTTAQSSAFSFVLAIDSSQSMEADDLVPTRIDAAKETAKSFVDNAPIGVKIGVVSFSASTKIEKDLTERKDELDLAINGISIGAFGGTDLFEPVLTSSNLLKFEGQKAVIILSDGQENVGTLGEAIDYANYYGVVIHTIGMGTEAGGSTEYSFSKIKEDSLRSLAYETGGIYVYGGDKGNLTNAFSNIFQNTQRKVSIELSDYLLISSLVLLLLSFFLSNTRYVNLP
jgi:Ca-activated chloride channel homolog